MLEINNINVSYGAISALNDISMNVQAGEIVTLVGANGAGKTTILRTVSGLVRPTSGSVVFEGQQISGQTAQSIVSLGLSHVPEGRHVFADMTVLENLELGAFLRNDKHEITADMDGAFARFPILKKRLKQLAGTLSGGEQQMLAIARALMSRPRLLLLDEPSLGLAPLLVREIFSIICDINATGTTIMLIEQNAKMSMSIAHRAYVIENGRIVLSGDAKELAKSDEVQKAYLGG